jgi:hypothetical protein
MHMHVIDCAMSDTGLRTSHISRKLARLHRTLNKTIHAANHQSIHSKAMYLAVSRVHAGRAATVMIAVWLPSSARVHISNMHSVKLVVCNTLPALLYGGHPLRQTVLLAKRQPVKLGSKKESNFTLSRMLRSAGPASARRLARCTASRPAPLRRNSSAALNSRAVSPHPRAHLSFHVTVKGQINGRHHNKGSLSMLLMLWQARCCFDAHRLLVATLHCTLWLRRWKEPSPAHHSRAAGTTKATVYATHRVPRDVRLAHAACRRSIRASKLPDWRRDMWMAVM